MSNSPKRPTLKLPKPDEHFGMKELYKRLRNAIIALIPLANRGQDRERLIGFMNVINPGSYLDYGRLPVECPDGMSYSSKPMSCVIAMVSEAVIWYWKIKLNNPPIAEEKRRELLRELKTGIARLERIVVVGLDKCKIDGSQVRKFYISVPIEEQNEVSDGVVLS